MSLYSELYRGDVQQWLERNFLKLNNEKRDLLFISCRHQHSVFDLPEVMINGVVLHILDAVQDLGVHLNKFLNMNAHTSCISATCTFGRVHTIICGILP